MKKVAKSEFDHVVDVHLEIALEDVGPIKPWFDQNRLAWVFEHKLYPVPYSGRTKKEVIKGYPSYLREFIAHRLMGDLLPSAEKQTHGRVLKRENAERSAAKTKFDQLVDEHLKIALQEIGPIKPWFDPEVQEWVFEHQLYPVEYGGNTKKEVVERFPLYLQQFIEHRLKGNLAPFVEKRTRGRGGKREGAGRPVGTTKAPTAVVRVPLDIAVWLKADPNHLDQVRALLNH